MTLRQTAYTDYGYAGIPSRLSRVNRGEIEESKPQHGAQPCPDWLGTEWRIVADRRTNPGTSLDYWAWRLDTADREALTRARDAGNAVIVTVKEDETFVLKAVRLR